MNTETRVTLNKVLSEKQQGIIKSIIKACRVLNIKLVVCHLEKNPNSKISLIANTSYVIFQSNIMFGKITSLKFMH